jgi:glutathione S-transferase
MEGVRRNSRTQEQVLTNDFAEEAMEFAGGAMLTLYKFRNSICTQKVLITLAEKQLPYEAVEINLFKSEQYDPAYLKINPKGVVPSIVHDGKAVIESTLICEYLDECFPQPPLMPNNPHGRARMRLWSKIVDEQLFAATAALSFSAMFRDRMRHMSEDLRQSRFRNVGDPQRTARMKSWYEFGVDSPYVYEGIAAYEKAFKTMQADLVAGGPWLLGKDFTLADVNMVPFVARLDYLDLLDVWIADRPHVRDWWERSRARASYITAIPDMLTADDVAEMRNSGIKIKQRVGERRAEYLAEAQPSLAGAA